MLLVYPTNLSAPSLSPRCFIHMVSFGKVWSSRNTGSSSSSSTNAPIKLHFPRTSSDVALPYSASASSSLGASCAEQLTPPPRAHYSTMQLQDDMFAEFFGAKPNRARALERHIPLPCSREGECEKRPAYAACPCPGADDEPVTLARYLFVYGFCTSLRLPVYNRI